MPGKGPLKYGGCDLGDVQIGHFNTQRGRPGPSSAREHSLRTQMKKSIFDFESKKKVKKFRVQVIGKFLSSMTVQTGWAGLPVCGSDRKGQSFPCNSEIVEAGPSILYPGVP
jgi:hypothetical protein